MYVHVDATSIKVEVRCAECDQCMDVEDQYEYNGVLTVVVPTCKECEEEE